MAKAKKQQIQSEHPHVCIDRTVSRSDVARAAERARASDLRRARLLSRASTPLPLRPARLALDTRFLWQTGQTLRIRFLDGIDSVQNKVADVAQEWTKHANIKLDFGDDPDAEIRISFLDRGSWSYIGNYALSIDSNKATMNYGWLTPDSSADEIRRVVVHEFGHALGCIHEHQNPAANIPWDREAVYRYYGGPPNYWSRDQVDVNLFQKYDTNHTQFSQFDTKSIMLYPIPNAHTIGDYEVGLNTDLSDTDKQFIATIYPGAEKRHVELKIGEYVDASIGQHGEEDSYVFAVLNDGVYTIETEGPTDVIMELFGPDDDSLFIAEDDDSGPDLNARITRCLSPGTYLVRVRHYWTTGIGRYRISVRSGV